MPSQPSPKLWRGRSAAGRAALVVGLTVGIPVALGVGLVLLALGVVGAAVGLIGWLIGAAAAWLWFGVSRRRRTQYPFASPPPSTRRGRRIALSGLYLALVPRAIGGTARVAGWLFSPLALLISVVGIL